MSDRIPPLSEAEIKAYRAFNSEHCDDQREYWDWKAAQDHAITYAIQESQPVSEAEIEAVAWAISDAVYTSAGGFRDAARAALAASGRVVEEAPQ